MESYEARNHVDKLESALRRLRLDSERLYKVKSELDKAKRENKKLKEQLKEANESSKKQPNSTRPPKRARGNYNESY